MDTAIAVVVVVVVVEVVVQRPFARRTGWIWYILQIVLMLWRSDATEGCIRCTAFSLGRLSRWRFRVRDEKREGVWIAF